jgi:hypothetical protein
MYGPRIMHMMNHVSYILGETFDQRSDDKSRDAGRYRVAITSLIFYPNNITTTKSFR